MLTLLTLLACATEGGGNGLLDNSGSKNENSGSGGNQLPCEWDEEVGMFAGTGATPGRPVQVLMGVTYDAPDPETAWTSPTKVVVYEDGSFYVWANAGPEFCYAVSL